jgi:hypothetical protein
MRQFKDGSSHLQIAHPICRDYRVPMWLTRAALELTNPEHEKRTLECKACGDMVRDR